MTGFPVPDGAPAPDADIEVGWLERPLPARAPVDDDAGADSVAIEDADGGRATGPPASDRDDDDADEDDDGAGAGGIYSSSAANRLSSAEVFGLAMRGGSDGEGSQRSFCRKCQLVPRRTAGGGGGGLLPLHGRCWPSSRPALAGGLPLSDGFPRLYLQSANVGKVVLWATADLAGAVEAERQGAFREDTRNLAAG